MTNPVPAQGAHRFPQPSDDSSLTRFWRRLAAWALPPLLYDAGVLARYRALAGSASGGVPLLA